MAKPKRDSHIDIPNHIFREILTPSEIRMLKNRFSIIQHLEQGLSIRRVAEKVKVGTDTVVRVARMMGRSNLSKILSKQRNNRQIKTNTPWIFGKSH